MHITAYLQPERTYLPCTGVGRHINNILLHLSQHQDIEISLLVSNQYFDANGKLDPRTPLHEFDLCTYPYKRLMTERLWKFCSLPKMDKFIGTTDCLYSPVAEYVPVNREIPMIITMHDMHTLEPNLPWSNSLGHTWQKWKTQVWISKVFNRVDHICTVSNYSKQRIIDLLGINPEKITTVGNGVDNSFFEIADVDIKDLQAPIPLPYVILIGGLKYKKGGYYVLEVAKELKIRKSSLKILVVGSSEPSLIEAANTLDNVILQGIIPDDELPKLLRMASSLLFLSLYEGFGIPMVEAMASGVPAVVANRGALPDVGGSAAIVVELENAAVIADILINLEKDTQLRDSYIQLGRNHAKKFTWNNCVDRLVEVLHKYS
ncbi:glycosyltransferase family 1 protein [Anabaena sp. 4-3]|uniref:glycosyltransferase family 4 protein n=1 Tax=Anabaena sp. 4-3 TaxID=1811979 RepID=UPI000833B1AF|nr:glycosyltransferase family 1 protein [Anabaena sp. 4-3]